MRYFKLIGTDSFSFYEEGRLKVIRKGQVVKTFVPAEATRFESNNLFLECDETGKIGSYAQVTEAEKITSRTVYTYNRDGNLIRR